MREWEGPGRLGGGPGAVHGLGVEGLESMTGEEQGMKRAENWRQTAGMGKGEQGRAAVALV